MYGIRAGVFYRNDAGPGAGPGRLVAAGRGGGAGRLQEALLGRRRHDPAQVWPWQAAGSSSPRRSCATATSSRSSSPTRPPGEMRSASCGAGWSSRSGRRCAMLVAVGAAGGSPAGCCGRCAVLTRPPTTSPPADAARVAVPAGRRSWAAGAVLQRDGGQRRERAGTAARLRRRRLAPAAQPAGRAAAAHRAARPGAARGQRGDRRRARRGQAAGRFWTIAGPGAGRTQRGGPPADRHRPAHCRTRRLLASDGGREGRAPDPGRGPGRHRLGRPHSALERPGRGHRQRPEVHPGRTGRTGHGRPRGGPATTVVVADQGAGLTEQELERVGDRFWSSTATRTSAGRGSASPSPACSSRCSPAPTAY
ncbi:hypothetical protein SMICM17S_12070 [Streptomyces microflavus]